MTKRRRPSYMDKEEGAITGLFMAMKKAGLSFKKGSRFYEMWNKATGEEEFE